MLSYSIVPSHNLTRWLGRGACNGGFRWFTSRALLNIKASQLPPRTRIDESEIEESFLKGGGAGGQKINKTNSAVQLQHAPTGIVVKSQATRSRSQNRKIARQLLAERIEEAEKGDEARTAIKAKLKQKKKASRQKKSRRKYRALEEAKLDQPDEDDVERKETLEDDDNGVEGEAEHQNDTNRKLDAGGTDAESVKKSAEDRQGESSNSPAEEAGARRA